jgi:hypothetical protein
MLPMVRLPRGEKFSIFEDGHCAAFGAHGHIQRVE